MNAERQTHQMTIWRWTWRVFCGPLPVLSLAVAADPVRCRRGVHGPAAGCPKYKGEAQLIIESTDNLPGASRGQEEERALLDSEGVASQVQLLMSADLGAACRQQAQSRCHSRIRRPGRRQSDRCAVLADRSAWGNRGQQRRRARAQAFLRKPGYLPAGRVPRDRGRLHCGEPGAGGQGSQHNRG